MPATEAPTQEKKTTQTSESPPPSPGAKAPQAQPEPLAQSAPLAQAQSAPADHKPESKPEPKAEPKQLTPEEVAQQQDEFASHFFGKRAAKGIKPPAEPKEAIAPPAAPAIPEPKPKPKTEESKPESKTEPKAEQKPLAEPHVPPPIFDALSGVEKPVRKSKAEAPVTAPELDLSDTEKRELNIYSRMEKLNPINKGLADRTKRFWQRAADYQTRWEREHPGEAFNEDAEEHAQFFNQAPAYNEDEYEAAREDLVEERLREKLRRELAEENKKLTREQSLRMAEPEIAAERDRAVVEFVSQASPDVARLMEKDGKIILTPEIEKAIEEKHPIAHAILNEEAEPLAVELEELERLFRFPDRYEWDTRKTVLLKQSDRHFNPHLELLQFMEAVERGMLSRPPQETVRAGRRLVSNAEWASAVERIEGSDLSDNEKVARRRSLEGNYYHLDLPDWKAALVAKHSRLASDRIKRFVKSTPSAQVTPKKESAETTEKAPSREEQEEPASTGRFKPPTTETSSETLNTGENPTDDERKLANIIAERMFGRRS